VKVQDVTDRQRLEYLYWHMPFDQRMRYGGDFEEWLQGIACALTWSDMDIDKALRYALQLSNIR